jgi:hypothetical protein
LQRSDHRRAELFAGVPREEVEAIVGMNAARVMNFDVAKLAKTPAAKLS